MSTLGLFDAQPVRASAPELGLRPYQREAVAETLAELYERKRRSTIVILPTGVGKTRCAGALAWAHVARGVRTLVLCPTITLVHQMYEALRALGLRATIEQADNRAERWAQVVVASVATLRQSRLDTWERNHFGLVVIDEAHRSVSPMYARIRKHFANAKLLGLTATPDRADGVALANVFESVAYEMSMLKAIEDGWLVPLRFKTAVTSFDASRIRTLAGEVDASSVAEELTRAGLLHDAANTLADLSAGERTVAFLPTVASSKAFVAELIARGVKAEHVDGTTAKDVREGAFERFAKGDTRVLSNVAVLTEGWDCPEASVVALLSPTKSRSRLTQMIGRGTRLAPGKTHTLVLDFCPGRLKKGRLASPADALAGKMLPDDVFDALDTEGDLAEAISDAETMVKDIEEQKRRAAESSRRKHLMQASLSKLSSSREYTYGVQEHNAQALLGGQGSDASTYHSDGGEPRDAELERARRGLCTPKQAALLKRFGLNPDLSKNLAGFAIDRIRGAGWTVPDALKTPRFMLSVSSAVDASAALAELSAK